jgi:hypothetical protein
MKRIVAYGCSFVQGTGLDPIHVGPSVVHLKSWPFLVGKKLKIDNVLNKGLGGGSNKYSIIKLFNDIVNEDFSDTLVIFSWTHILRTVFFDTNQKSWQPVMVDENFSDKKLQTAYSHYYGTIYTDYEATYDLIQQQIFLQSFFKERKIKHVFVNGIQNDKFDKEDTFLCNLENMIDKNNYALGYYDSIQDNISRNNFKCYDNYHPNEDGHAHIADQITQFIKTKYA